MQGVIPRPAAAGRPTWDVTVVLLDGGLPSTAIMPVEIFSAAGALWRELRGEAPDPAFRVTTVSLGGGPLVTPHGFAITPQAAIGDVAQTDIVIVPTSGLDCDSKLREHAALLPWLTRQYEQGAFVAGVCMGSVYLAEAGLLHDRMATTHWAVAERMVSRFPAVRWRPDLFVTEDSRTFCSGGLYASIDLSLYLVEKLCGHEIAVQTAKALLLPMPRTFQTGYAVLPVSRPHDDDRIRAVEAHLAAHYPQDISVQALAVHAGLTERTFARRFKDATGRQPAAYLQALRIEAAKAMLERDAAPIQSISSAVGYDDIAFFRGLFKRHTRMTPTEYRAHFAPMSVRGQGA